MTHHNAIYYDAFMDRGWQPNYRTHPQASDAALEMVLIEPRDHKYLLKAISNMSCLIPHAALTILHSPDNAETLHRAIDNGGPHRVKLVPMFSGNITRDDYSKLMTSPELWANTLSSDKVLIFQTDSGMRYNDILRYMQYDYVGAPWNWTVSSDPRIQQGNGGFSLRSRKWMQHIASEFPFTMRGVPADDAEDVFFAKHIIDCYDAQLPPREEAANFSVEYFPHENPMGFHQAWCYHPEETVVKWMTEGLDPSRPTTQVELLDAWIETQNGRCLDSSTSKKLLSWLRLGLGPNGFRMSEGTLIPFVTCPDPCPGMPKRLFMKVKHKSETFLYRTLLTKGRITDTILIK